MIHQGATSLDLLPAIDEEKELRFNKHNASSALLQNTECSDSSSNSRLRDFRQSRFEPINPSLINRSDGLPFEQRSIGRNAGPSYARRHQPIWQENYPSISEGDDHGMSHQFRSGNTAGIPRSQQPSIASASYAYHATPANAAFSSNYYPVTKQNSEVQSQSSGALGGKLNIDLHSVIQPEGVNQTRFT